MDLHSLVAAHMPETRRPARMGGSEEDRYYSDRIAQRRPRLRQLAWVGAIAGVILLLVGIAQI